MKMKSLVSVCFFFYASLLAGYTHLDASDADTNAASYDENYDYGGYTIQIGAAKPSFTKLNRYGDVYGNTNIYPTFGVTYKFVQLPLLTLGAGLKFSYYAANGHPLLSNGDSDKSSTLSLRLVPYQFYADLRVSPFRRYVVFDFWLGYEELYYEEVRLLAATPSVTSTTTTATQDKAKNVINSGWNKNITYGLAVNFLINQFEDQTAKALHRTTSLRFIYAAPFVEYSMAMGGRLFISQQGATGVDFSRTSYGILFTFET